MDPRELALYGVGLPAIVAAAAAILLSRVAPRRLRGLPESIALAIGFIASWVALEGMPTLPPRLAHEWLPVVAAVAPLVVAGAARLPATAATVLMAAALAGTMAAIGWPPGWSTTERILSSAALLAMTLAHHLCIRRMPDPERAWLLPAISGATAAALAASGTITVGHAAGALACGQVALLAVHLLRPARCAPGEATVLPSLLLMALWLTGAWFNELPWSVLVLLAAAPVAYLLPGTPRRILGRSTRTWIALLVLAVAVGTSLWFRYSSTRSGY